MEKRIAVLAVLCVAAVVTAQIVDQGAPGNQGPWPVTTGTCVSPTHTITSVLVTATTTPATQLTSRTSITFCNSIENTGGQKVKCRVDGSNPVMGSSNVGDVLGIGDCITYSIGAGVVPKCIADATAAVTGLECI